MSPICINKYKKINTQNIKGTGINYQYVSLIYKIYIIYVKSLKIVLEFFSSFICDTDFPEGKLNSIKTNHLQLIKVIPFGFTFENFDQVLTKISIVSYDRNYSK